MLELASKKHVIQQLLSSIAKVREKLACLGELDQTGSRSLPQRLRISVRPGGPSRSACFAKCQSEWRLKISNGSAFAFTTDRKVSDIFVLTLHEIDILWRMIFHLMKE